VSTACPGSVEILSDGKYGKLVAIGDAEELARSIITIIESEPDKLALRQRSLDFSAERSVAHYERILAGTEL
ncbi:MAG: glycosyltransferase, partial [Halioglobus sp.]|nr:glycosyltransferase [Halioglobus sp.]